MLYKNYILKAAADSSPFTHYDTTKMSTSFPIAFPTVIIFSQLSLALVKMVNFYSYFRVHVIRKTASYSDAVSPLEQFLFCGKLFLNRDVTMFVDYGKFAPWKIISEQWYGHTYTMSRLKFLVDGWLQSAHVSNGSIPGVQKCYCRLVTRQKSNCYFAHRTDLSD